MNKQSPRMTNYWLNYAVTWLVVLSLTFLGFGALSLVAGNRTFLLGTVPVLALGSISAVLGWFRHSSRAG
jgi:hypothetical protein